MNGFLHLTGISSVLGDVLVRVSKVDAVRSTPDGSALLINGSWLRVAESLSEVQRMINSTRFSMPAQDPS